MTALRNRRVSLFFLLLLVLLIPLAAHAQTAGQILINYPEIADEGDGLGLSVYFNIVDSSGQVVTNADVGSARILTDDGQGYDATVQKPTSPIASMCVRATCAITSLSRSGHPMRPSVPAPKLMRVTGRWPDSNTCTNP